MDLSIPHNFQPREYQIPLLQWIDDGHKRAIALWHRRAGKDLVLWNMTIKKAFQKKGLYFYFLPTYTQAKKIIWDGINNDGFSFLDYIPEVLIKNKNATEMKLELKNGSVIQLIGTDHYDAIRGTNPVGCVFSEFAFQNPMAWEVVKPILKVNGGWAIFNTTPNGKNHAYELYEMARDNDDWFCEKLTVADTGVLTSIDISEERKEGMTEEMVLQEYYCSFDIGTQGSYYAKYMNEARDQDRICGVPWEKAIPVDLWLDLGRNDSTSIVFTQRVGKEIRIIDFYEENGEDIGHYVQTLNEKAYQYGTMYLPHDAKHKRLESAKTIEEQFKEAGFKTKVVPKLGIDQGIQLVRKYFPRMWFDKTKTKQLIRSLENYHKEWDPRAKVFRNNPKHDWSSHAADAIRYMCVGWEEDRANEMIDYTKAVKDIIGDDNYSPELGRNKEQREAMREYEREVRKAMNI